MPAFELLTSFVSSEVPPPAHGDAVTEESQDKLHHLDPTHKQQKRDIQQEDL